MSKLVIVFFSVLLVLSFPTRADEFEQYRAIQNQAYLNDNIQFEKNKTKENIEFELYRKKILNAYKRYKNQIAKYWGANNTIISDRRQWAEYHDNMTQRNIVDFKNGKVKVEILLDKKDKNNLRVIHERLNKAIVFTVTKAVDKRSILELVRAPAQDKNITTVHSKPALDKQVKLKSGELVTVTNASTFAEETTSNSLSTKSQKGTDGVERIIASTQFSLIPDHIRKRAELFKPTVKKFAKEYNVSQNLIYAVIETESFFNPVARSNAPAFGLMQLVPFYGAREAYRFVYKKDHIPSDTYLYNPKNNINLGSAYLHVLYFNHMSGIKNEQSRLWCAIASYNTGPTNVYRAVIGKYSRTIFRKYSNWKNKAIREINKLNSEQLYQLLRQQLPQQETRSYIQKVRFRMNKYSSM